MSQSLITALNSTDRLISLQFDFNNLQAVPWNLRQMPQEQKVESQVRRQQSQHGTGIDLLPAKPQGVKLGLLPVDLVKAGYILVSAQYQERVDKHNATKRYHMTRFIFVRAEHERKDDQQIQTLLPLRGIMLTELMGLCQTAHWQVRAFRNPYLEQGQLINGQFALSINFDGRVPLFEDSQVLARTNDLPKPQHYLSLAGNQLLLLS